MLSNLAYCPGKGVPPSGSGTNFRGSGPTHVVGPTSVSNHGFLMSITKERKQALIGDYRRGEADTGSPEVQIALLTARIQELTEHLKTHAKDFASRRGLLMMVSRRRRLLDYLKRVTPERYLDVIRRLEIRK